MASVRPPRWGCAPRWLANPAPPPPRPLRTHRPRQTTPELPPPAPHSPGSSLGAAHPGARSLDGKELGSLVPSWSRTVAARRHFPYSVQCGLISLPRRVAGSGTAAGREGRLVTGAGRSPLPRRLATRRAATGLCPNVSLVSGVLGLVCAGSPSSRRVVANGHAASRVDAPCDRSALCRLPTRLAWR